MSIDVEGLKARTDIAAVVGSYVSLKKRAGEYLGLCPFHADKNPSFYVIPQKGFCKCFSCGWSGDVVDFVQEKEGVDFKDACERLGATDQWKPAPIAQSAPPLPERITSKPPADAPPCRFDIRSLGEPSRVWHYLDTDGALLGYVTRYDPPEGKQIRQWTWGARGPLPPAWGCGHWNKLRPMYGLDRLAARPTAPVLMVEGEKAADAAAEFMPTYVVVSWPGGAQAWKHVDFAQLRGRRVDFWPDNDEPGRAAVQGIIGIISAPDGLNCHGKIIDPAGTPEGFDAADWTPELGDVMQWAAARVAWYREPVAALERAAEIAAAEGDFGTAYGLANFASAPAETLDPIAFPPLEAYADEQRSSPAKKPPRKKRHLHAVDGNAALAPAPETEPAPAALSEDALAEHFVQEYGENWRFCTEWNLWLQWLGDGWHRDKRNEVSDVCKLITRQALDWDDALKISDGAKQKLNSKRTAWNARDLAAVDRRISLLAEKLDADPMLLGVPGGVVDLRSGKLLQAEPEQYITRRCTVAPADGAHPLFDRVLARACAGHDGMREYLLRWFGYMLTGDIREEALMFLHGPGGSGKSTLIKCLTEILGDYAMAINMEALTETKQQRHSQEIAKLAGARLVYASETEEGRRWNEALIKWLTGRDKITAHKMRQDDIEFMPQFKLLVYGNSVPHLKSVGEEMRRRFHLVEYAGSLLETERDTTLKDRLVAEYPAILATLVRGCVDWQDCAGLGKPESVTASVDNYLESEDTLGQFIDEALERDPRAKELSGAVYRRYSAWCEATGEKYVMSQKRLVQALGLRGFAQVRTNAARMIGGFRIRATGDASQERWDRR